MKNLTGLELNILISLIKKGVDVSPFFESFDSSWLYKQWDANASTIDKSYIGIKMLYE